MKFIRDILERIGYYCPACERYTKTFNPPFGRRACIDCQIEDVDQHGVELHNISERYRLGIASNEDLVRKVEQLRDRFLQSKEEPRDLTIRAWLLENNMLPTQDHEIEIIKHPTNQRELKV